MRESALKDLPPHVLKAIERAECEAKARPHVACHGKRAAEQIAGRSLTLVAKGRKVEPEYRSQLEADRAEYLERKKLAGEILAWWYEPCQLQIGGGAKYKPDFLVFNADQSLDFEETKGFWREAHRIRIKTAAARFPIFRFRGITRESGEWQVEEFKP